MEINLPLLQQAIDYINDIGVDFIRRLQEYEKLRQEGTPSSTASGTAAFSWMDCIESFDTYSELNAAEYKKELSKYIQSELSKYIQSEIKFVLYDTLHTSFYSQERKEDTFNTLFRYQNYLGQSLVFDCFFARSLIRTFVHSPECNDYTLTNAYDCVRRMKSVFLAHMTSATLQIIQSVINKTDPSHAIAQLNLGAKFALLRLNIENCITVDITNFLCFCKESIYLALILMQSLDREKAWEESGRYVYTNIVCHLQRNGIRHAVDLIKYAEQGLQVSDPASRWSAFRTLGMCAMEEPTKKQLAYDTFLSWLKQKPVGVVLDILPSRFFEEWDENDWRISDYGQQCISESYINLGNISMAMADSYEMSNPKWIAFYSLAEQYFHDGLAECDSELIYEGLGQVQEKSKIGSGSYRSAFNLYMTAYKKSKTFTWKKRIYLERACNVLLSDMLCALNTSHKKGRLLDDWFTNNIKQFQKWNEYYTLYQSENESNTTKVFDLNSNRWHSFSTLCAQCKSDDVNFRLLMIFHLAEMLRASLKRVEYCKDDFRTRVDEELSSTPDKRSNVMPIACYTTLKTASYLFDTMYRCDIFSAPHCVVDSKSADFEDGINCLTLMHAHYMNDPNEGVVLGNVFSKLYPKDNIVFFNGNATKFRGEIYDNNFVFLKSFTQKPDNLLMWNRYGSDRTCGSKDSNGCYVQFNTDYFDKAIKHHNDSLLDEADDYSLYRVLYLSQTDGTLSEEKNPNLPKEVAEYYGLMLKMISNINEKLKNLDDAEILAAQVYMQDALKYLSFLFKFDDYADEEEYRLIEIRTHDKIDCIDTVGDNPKLLCINPYFQIAIDKIVLGPNVDKPDAWSNYFRCEMIKMWKRALKTHDISLIPPIVVDRSKIDYRT